MNDPSHTPPIPPSDIEQLGAYLDGELSAPEAAELEQRLGNEPAYRAQLEKMRQAWSFLDELQLESGSTEFTDSTVMMAAQEATRKVRPVVQRHQFRWSWMALACLVLSASSYLITNRSLTKNDRQFLRDLPVIEQVDAYQNVNDIEFLRTLANDGVFLDGVVGDAS